jgi:S-phase kinase-associated protein 1
MSDMAATDNNMCILTANDGVQINVPIEVAKISITIKNMLEDLDEMYGSTDENAIPIPTINGPILEKIMTFCDYIYHNQTELENLNIWLNDKTFTVPLSHWFVEYLNIDQQTLFDVILGANFLDIQSLLNMQCKYVATIIRNKTPEELRILFGTNQNVTETASTEDNT